MVAPSTVPMTASLLCIDDDDGCDTAGKLGVPGTANIDKTEQVSEI